MKDDYLVDLPVSSGSHIAQRLHNKAADNWKWICLEASLDPEFSLCLFCIIEATEDTGHRTAAPAWSFPTTASLQPEKQGRRDADVLSATASACCSRYAHQEVTGCRARETVTLQTSLTATGLPICLFATFLALWHAQCTRDCCDGGAHECCMLYACMYVSLFVCVCMSGYICALYVCIYLCMCVLCNACVSVCTCVCMYICLYVYVCLHICVPFVYVYICVGAYYVMYICVCICMYVYVCPDMCVPSLYVYIYGCMYYVTASVV